MVAVAFLVTSVFLATQTTADETVVWADRITGASEYHTETCPLLVGGKKYPIPRGVSRHAGAVACDVCLPDGPRKVQTLRIARAKFEDVYRAGKALEAAVEVGLNKIRFSELLQNFAAAQSILRDKLRSADEQQLAGHYEVALITYRAAYADWDADSPVTRRMILQSGAKLQKANELLNASVTGKRAVNPVLRAALEKVTEAGGFAAPENRATPVKD